jgi:hypothetical protein
MSINTEYEEKVNDAIYTFEHVSSPNELQKLTVDFIKGKIIATNYHYNPLHKESNKIIDELIKMNELGFITTSSKPGDLTESKRQRGYVRGLLRSYKYDEFVKLMYNMCNNIYIRFTHDNTLIKSLKNIGTFPEWYWISENKNENYKSVRNVERPFIEFLETDIYEELINYYYEIEIIDLEWGRENYIHNKINIALNIIDIDSE